jgi:competence protein ComEA
MEGPVNVNTATVEELQTLPAIGAVMAERIIAARPFRAPLDLLKVDGLGQHIWAQLQDHIVV